MLKLIQQKRFDGLGTFGLQISTDHKFPDRFMQENLAQIIGFLVSIKS